MEQQLAAWQGEFGKAYTDRNVVDWQDRVPWLRGMLDGIAVSSALEVGCNRGHNLIALSEIFGAECDIVGIEPNRYALGIARESSSRVGVLRGTIFDLPFRDNQFDLAMTSGVLIHVATEDLSLALENIYRVSRRYILAVEYFAEEDTVLNYRGHDNLLWKRDFGKHYLQQFPDLRLLRDGFRDAERGADETNWWLFEKG
jgi:pseudaminic acid biosynthesis-associated methylase